MEGVALIHSPHPLLAAANREIKQSQWRPGDTLAEVLQKAGITPLVPCVVLYNGSSVSVDQWSVIVPAAGDLISVRATVHGGGDGGSNPIAAVLSIALMVVAPYLAPALIGIEGAAAMGSVMTGLVSSAITGAVVLAGNMIIGALFKPETSGIAKAQGIPNASPSYSISGIQNRTRPYEPMPLVYGTHRLVVDMSAKPYTKFKGDDQYLEQQFCLGVSDLVVSDWKVGDTALSSYKNWTMKESNPDGTIPGFYSDVDTLEGGTLEPGVWITRTLPLGTVRCEIDIQGNLYSFDKEGKLQALECEFKAQLKRDDEAWVDFIRGKDTVTLTNYWSVGYYAPGGAWMQGAYGRTVAADHVDGSAYVPPSGSPLFFTSLTWRWLTFAEADAASIPLTQQPERTASIAVPYVTLSNKEVNLIRKTYATSEVFPEGLDPSATYQVRVIRTTPAYTKAKDKAEFALTSVRAIQEVNFANDETSYVGQRRIGVEIRATGQLNGVIDTLNCIASAKVKAGIDPAIMPSVTSNPAWAALDFIRGRFRTYTNQEGQTRTSRMYGVGLAETRIDLASIQAWATFCANKGLEFNGIFDQQASCAEVLQKIARCGRASVTWNTGKIGFIWDADNQPVTAVFGMANIRAGSFSISYASGKLADEVVVTFINKDTGYQRDTVRQSRAGVTNPTNPVELELFGCTDVDQAGKEANLLMAGQDYRRRMITWETDVEGLCVTRGDVVLLSHDLTQWSYSGRVVNFDGGVRLNRSIPVGGDTGKNLMLRAPDGTLYTLVVTNADGETDLLTGTMPSFAGTNPMDWLWFFGPQATPGKKVKIASVEPLDELHVRLTAVDEEAAYYAAENGTYTYVPIESVSLISPRVTKLVINESITNKNGYWQPSALIEWSVENAASWIVEVTRNGNTAYQSADAKTSQLDIPMAVGDLVNVTVIPVSTFGVNGSIANAAKTLTGAALNAKPADIPMVNAVYEGKTIWLTWNQVEDFRGITYEVRYGESWGAGSVYPCGSALRFKTQGDGNYFVAAKTGNGIYSANPKGIRVEGSTLVANVIATQDEAGTGWSGEFDRTYTKANQLCMAGTSLFSTFNPVSSENSVILAGGFDSEGYYRIPEDHIVDIGTPGACQVTSSIAFDVHDPKTLIAAVPSFAALPSVKCPAGGTGSVEVEMNIAQADGVFSGWQPFQPGTYLARLFDFRLALGSTNPMVSPFVSAWQVSVDVPDRIDSAEVTTPAGTLAVTFAKPFNDLPKIQATIQNASAGDDIVVTSITENGFSLTVKNGGASVSRVVHYLAQGY